MFRADRNRRPAAPGLPGQAAQRIGGHSLGSGGRWGPGEPRPAVTQAPVAGGQVMSSVEPTLSVPPPLRSPFLLGPRPQPHPFWSCFISASIC